MKRFIKIALSYIVVHVAVAFLLFWGAFFCGMSAFTDGSLIPLGEAMGSLIALMNLPLFYINGDSVPASFLDKFDVLLAAPPLAQILWPIVLGCFIAVLWILIFRRSQNVVAEPGDGAEPPFSL